MIETLTWLAGAGLSVVSSFILDRIEGFNSLSPNGKQTISMLVAVLIAVFAMATRDWFVANPKALFAAEPYGQILITAASIFIQQITYAARKVAGGKENG